MALIPTEYIYSGPCILRPPLIVLNWRDINTENIRVVSLISGLKIEGIVKRSGLNL